MSTDRIEQAIGGQAPSRANLAGEVSPARQGPEAPGPSRAWEQIHVRRWHLLPQNQPTAEAQMGFDVQLAQRQTPTLRMFHWAEPALSLGYRQAPPEWIDSAQLKTAGIELVERPTGGGIAIHGSDLSLSIVAPHAEVPSGRALLQAACDTLVAALRPLGVSARADTDTEGSSRIDWCLTESSPYALFVGQQKLCGFALRRFPSAWLVQGSLLLRPVPQVFEAVLPAAARAALTTRAVTLSQAAGRRLFDEEVRAAIGRAWRQASGVPCEWPQAALGAQAEEWLNQGDVVATKWWRNSYAPKPPSQPAHPARPLGQPHATEADAETSA